MVTSKGVGLAVPDWPTTFGYNMFLFPVSQWVGGILFEHTHRLIASVVGILTIVLAVALSRVEDRRYLRRLGWIALGAVVFQGVLGGLRVTMLKDEIGIFHACIAHSFFALLVFIALATTRTWRRIEPAFAGYELRAAQRLSILLAVLIYGQLALGATMRHQHRDLAILDFPTANGQWIPDTSAPALEKINEWREARALSDVRASHIWLQMAHRLNAIAVAAIVVALWFAARKLTVTPPPLSRITNVLLVAIAIQLVLGAWTIWSNKAADVATAHVAVGAVSLVLAVSCAALAFRFSEDAQDRQSLVAETQSPRHVIA